MWYRSDRDELHGAIKGDTEPILTMLGNGTATMTLRDLAIFMVVLSDNTATNILIDRLGYVDRHYLRGARR
jgi:hypothetical protein